MIALLAACDGWPALDGLARDDTGGAPPEGVELTDPPELSWSESGPRDDETDDSALVAPVEILPPGQAFTLAGKLRGAGWDPAAVPTRAACAGVPSAFPTEPSGDYLGDADWRVIEVQASGALCAHLEPSTTEARVDLMAFDLDSCGLPARAWTTRDDLVMGFAPSTAVNDWATLVEPSRFAMVAVAYAPDDTTLEIPYAWTVAALAVGEEPERCGDIEW